MCTMRFQLWNALFISQKGQKLICLSSANYFRNLVTALNCMYFVHNLLLKQHKIIQEKLAFKNIFQCRYTGNPALAKTDTSFATLEKAFEYSCSAVGYYKIIKSNNGLQTEKVLYGIWDWSVCPSDSYASTAACTKLYLKEIKETNQNSNQKQKRSMYLRISVHILQNTLKRNSHTGFFILDLNSYLFKCCVIYYAR